MDEALVYEILAVVGEIPEGRVATYGQIARLIGRERNARRTAPLRPIRRLPLPPGREPLRPPCPRLAGAGLSLAAGGRPGPPRWPCGPQALPMGRLTDPIMKDPPGMTGGVLFAEISRRLSPADFL